jgi:cold shock CspA family protein
MLRVSQGNVTEAQYSYESALELKSDSPSLHYFFADFLLREALQPSLALEHLQIAARLDPDTPMVAIDISPAFTLLQRHDEARDACIAGITAAAAPTEVRSRLMENFLKSLMAEALDRHQGGDLEGAIAILQDIKRLETEGAALVAEPAVRDRMQHVYQLAGLCVERVADAYVGNQGAELLHLLEGWLGPYRTTDLERFYGKVVKIVQDKGFAFIRPLGGGADVFMHCSHVVPSHDWGVIQEGSEVSFASGPHRGRIQALNVWLLG